MWSVSLIELLGREYAIVFVHVQSQSRICHCYRQLAVLQWEAEKSLWGRDKNGEAAPRTRSTSTTPDPS